VSEILGDLPAQLVEAVRLDLHTGLERHFGGAVRSVTVHAGRCETSLGE
jgi:hypothetical protein